MSFNRQVWATTMKMAQPNLQKRLDTNNCISGHEEAKTETALPFLFMPYIVFALSRWKLYPTIIINASSCRYSEAVAIENGVELDLEKTYLKCKNWDTILCPYSYHELMVKTYIRPNFPTFQPNYKENQRLNEICQGCPKFEMDSSMYTWI